MKNTRFFFSVCFLSCFTLAIFGQTEKGNFLIGGETKLDFSSMNSKWETDDNQGNNGNTTNFELSPQIGFFVVDGLALGLELPISISMIKNGVGDKSNSTSITLAPFVRYYFGSSNLKPYLQGEIGFGKLKTKHNPVLGSSYDLFASIFSYEIGGGLGIFLNEKVSLDVGLGYSSLSVKFGELNDNYKGISNGIGAKIGFIIIL